MADVTEQPTRGTRDRIVGLLRGEPRTVEELAAALGVTKNAIRSHLPSLERDGLVEAVGRRQSRRKPAVLYRTTAAAEERLSRAYVPLLDAILAALENRVEDDALTALLVEAGRRLVPEEGGRRAEDDDAQAGAERASEFLKGLGGLTQVERDGAVIRIRGASCPLGAVVREHPEVCRAVEAVVGTVAGHAARECCDRSERPSCCFELRLDR